MSYGNSVDFSSLLGKILTSATGAVGENVMRFQTIEGERFVLLHNQDCFATVSIEDIVGDIADLIGSPITLAEESISNKDTENYSTDPTDYRDSFTWTFYRIATLKGHVDIRWLGESNGYYSESVDFEKVTS